MEIANQVDLMIVAGGKNSANTTHLAEILSPITQTLHIETAEELVKYKDLIQNSNILGVTAGASTPKEIIDEILKKIGEI